MDRLASVFEGTLKAIEEGKEEIFNIYESTRSEIQRLKKELEFLRLEIVEIIKKVDDQQRQEKKLRQKLMEVNKNFHNYTEKEMLEIYIETKDAQVELQLLQAKELQLRTRRDEIERTLKNLDKTVQRAETLMNQVSLAIRLLKEGINEISQYYSKDQRKVTAFMIIKAQEEERRKVAREIHDGPAQSLANIVLRLEIVEKLLEIDHKKVKKELQELNVLARENLKDIRRIIFDLRPIQLNSEGIVETIRNYIQNYEKNYGIKCELQVKGTERTLNPAIEVALFRMVQEGMTNVAKHAHSATCKVILEFRENSVLGRIIDNGRGFDVKEVLSNLGKQFGLIGIKERIEMYSGKFNLTSIPGQGTTFEFELPYSK
ncbi:MAG TPA: histidine kinase [Peptococcaceae bacterium]|nr:histidine kinase [Peptococcaceae bacterium]